MEFSHVYLPGLHLFAPSLVYLLQEFQTELRSLFQNLFLGGLGEYRQKKRLCPGLPRQSLPSMSHRFLELLVAEG